MSMSIETENLITLTQATKILPGRPNVSTVWRWATHGCRGIQLETMKIGGRTFTSREALQRFADECSGKIVKQSSSTARAREASIASAERLLAAA